MANKTNSLTGPIEGYLTPKAQKLVTELQQVGIDRDLAIAILETNLKDSEIFQLEELDEEE